MDSSGQNVRRLTNSPGFDRSPSFTTDGTKIIFSTERDGNKEIYSMAVDGTGATRLTYNAAGADNPVTRKPTRGDTPLILAH